MKKRGVSFDFWDTLAVDGSDEFKRAQGDLRPKPEARLDLLMESAKLQNPNVSREKVANAFQIANERFDSIWKLQFRTPSVAERMGWAYDLLSLSKDSGFLKVVHAIESMEVECPPEFVPRVAETLERLSKNFSLAIISDTIHTPGWGLRRILENAQLRKYFSVTVFSDEVQASKPSEVVFKRASDLLRIPLSQMIHVGDRESNDVSGPLKCGMKAILFTGVKDRGSAHTQATRVCRDFSELPGMLEPL